MMKNKTGLSAGRPSQNLSKINMADEIEIEKEVRINIQVTPAERSKIKIYAAKKGTTITDLFKKFIADLDE
jgi:hypothetical protein